MIDPRTVEQNLDNLRYVSERMMHLPHFVFYGTLLGYQREGTIITNDDDIDILVDRKHHDDIRAIFENTEVFIRRKREKFRTGVFLQGVRMIGDTRTFIDFYLYEDIAEHDYICENWNYTGDYDIASNAMHIPKSAIYPIQNAQMQGIDIKVPADPQACCEFLYGKSWQIPRSKATDYTMKIHDHLPVMVSRDTGELLE